MSWAHRTVAMMMKCNKVIARLKNYKKSNRKSMRQNEIAGADTKHASCCLSCETKTIHMY